jgi:sugar/nucleoside kinase (ribokinase family)
VVVGQVSWNSSASKRFGRGQLKLPLVNHRPRLYWPEAHGAEVAFVVVPVVIPVVVLGAGDGVVTGFVVAFVVG